MRMIIFVAALTASTAMAANAATWVASCNDGKNIQYVQTIKGAGYLYMKTQKDYFQVARLSQTSATETALCGTVIGNVPGNGAPVTEVCINKSRQLISLKYRNPGAPAADAQDAGEFCAATVTERATNLTER
jgi:hypothetical protein